MPLNETERSKLTERLFQIGIRRILNLPQPKELKSMLGEVLATPGELSNEESAWVTQTLEKALINVLSSYVVHMGYEIVRTNKPGLAMTKTANIVVGGGSIRDY